MGELGSARMNDGETKRYIAIVQFRSDSTLSRLGKDAPEVISLLKRLSNGENELAFTSNDGKTFGYFLKTTVPHFLKAEFEKCTGTRDGDAMLVFEAGKLIAGSVGFSRAFTWLQRH